MIFDGFGGREGFQGVHGGRGYVVTKFGLKRRHLDLIHTTFHDFAPFQAESKLNPGRIQAESSLDPAYPAWIQPGSG